MNLKSLFYKTNKKGCNTLKRDLIDIDYKKLKEMIGSSNCTLIDVRSNQEFKEEHLNGAINIPLDVIQNEIENKMPDKNIIIIVYCQYGSRSKKAQNILKDKGYKNVYNLKNGIDGI